MPSELFERGRHHQYTHRQITEKGLEYDSIDVVSKVIFYKLRERNGVWYAFEKNPDGITYRFLGVVS